MLKITTSAAAIAVALLAGPAALAQMAPAPTDAPATPAAASAAGVGPAAEKLAQGTQTREATGDADGEVIVTGTRLSGLRASDSPAPIQVLGNDTLKRVGQTELTQALAQTLPSIQVQGFANDQAQFHPQIKLRGLNPNETLILVDGKRRHGTANVVVSGGISSGGASPDIQLIPEDAIDHVEVLQDGAAAQYGTDAIAGVVNLILKKNNHGGTLNATVGQYEDGDGATYDISGNLGIAPIPDMYLSVTGERRHHDYSFRGDVDPRVVDTGYSTSANTGNNGGRTLLVRYPGITGFGNYPYVNRIFGDGKYDLTNAMYNLGYTGIHEHDIEIYSFGSYSRRVGFTYQNYRLPNVVFGKNAATTRNTTPYSGDVPYPNGFAPQEVLRETDYAVAGGVKGDIGGTTFDVAVNYGRDNDAIYVQNSANAALYYDTSQFLYNSAGTITGYQPGSSPTNFYDGSFIAKQINETLDLTHKFNIGFAEPVNVAAGFEHRYETYQLAAGDPASYYVSTNTAAPGGGAQSFFGYSPANASRNYRTDNSEYLEVDLKPVEKLLVQGAVRHEDYSDFGDATIFKATGRYDFSPALAIRGTVSTGFRAPTLAEGFYSGLNVSVSSISGIFAPNSAGAKALGIGGLGPEKSTNYSVGIVAHPTQRLSMTLDLYAIYLRNRIVQSAAFTGYSQNCKFLPGGLAAANGNITAAYSAFIAAKGVCTDVISPAVLTALTGNGVSLGGLIDTINQGASGSVSINSFVNGVTTLTHGADLLVTYNSDFGGLGRIDWSLSGNYNYTKVDRVAPPPANVNQSRALLDLGAVTTLVDTTPKWRVTGGALWSLGRFDVNLRESYYGPTYLEATFPTDGTRYVDNYISSRFITDLEVSFKPNPILRVSAGANNLFNTYPNQLSADFRAAQYSLSSTAYVTRYPSFSPFGVNGGYYYGRVSVRF